MSCLSVGQYNWGLRRDGAFPVFSLGALKESVDLLKHSLVEKSVRKLGVKDAAKLERNLMKEFK